MRPGEPTPPAPRARRGGRGQKTGTTQGQALGRGRKGLGGAPGRNSSRASRGHPCILRRVGKAGCFALRVLGVGTAGAGSRFPCALLGCAHPCSPPETQTCGGPRSLGGGEPRTLQTRAGDPPWRAGPGTTPRPQAPALLGLAQRGPPTTWGGRAGWCVWATPAQHPRVHLEWGPHERGGLGPPRAGWNGAPPSGEDWDPHAAGRTGTPCRVHPGWQVVARHVSPAGFRPAALPVGPSGARPGASPLKDRNDSAHPP